LNDFLLTLGLFKNIDTLESVAEPQTVEIFQGAK